jgi:pyrroline-5-carboxylate reductase
MTALGIIGGTGWLGGILAKGMMVEGVIAPGDLSIANRSGRFGGFEDWPGIHFTTDNQELVERSDVVLLSVPPQTFADVEISVPDKLVISVMAVIDIAAIRAGTGAARVIRSMPTFTAEFNLSYTPWYPTPAVTAADRETAQRLLTPSGLAEGVESEALIDFYTALTGSGPTFVTFLADAFIKSAVAHGVEPGQAERAVRMMFHGAGAHIAGSDKTPAELVQFILDYRGIATVGLQSMLVSGVAAGIHAAIAAAANKVKAGFEEG